MTSLSVDREREHAKPIEEAVRALVPSAFNAPNDGRAKAKRAIAIAAALECWDVWVAHGWITIDGLEAMKKERGME